MGLYLANQIAMGNLEYTVVLEKYPQHKQVIDDFLNGRGYGYLIPEGE